MRYGLGFWLHQLGGAVMLEGFDAVYQTPDIIAQRHRTLAALEPREGEHILGIGAGPALLVADMGAVVGPSGHVVTFAGQAEQQVLGAEAVVAEPARPPAWRGARSDGTRPWAAWRRPILTGFRSAGR